MRSNVVVPGVFAGQHARLSVMEWTRWNSHLLPFAFFTALTIAATPAGAVDGSVLITQAKAIAGAVTPGDAPGFPVTITAGGSYSLASNLQVPAGLTGILVTGVEVTIDLNGFRITGGGGGSGIGINGRQRGLTVRNGTIRAFGGDGISSAGAMLIVSDMRIEETPSAFAPIRPQTALQIALSMATVASGFGAERHILWPETSSLPIADLVFWWAMAARSWEIASRQIVVQDSLPIHLARYLRRQAMATTPLSAMAVTRFMAT